MKFPNKVTPYKRSIFPKLPSILALIKEKDYSVTTLYECVSESLSINEFIDVLDCLFTLGQITLRNEVLHYVKRNSI